MDSEPTEHSVRYTPASEACQQQYDFIVVGAGASGCVLASQLVQSSRKPSVLLIEAGDRMRDSSERRIPAMGMSFRAIGDEKSLQVSFQNFTEPQTHGCLSSKNRRCFWPSGRVVGGGTAINAMVFARGHRADFDRWAHDLGCEGWSFHDVLPHFQALETVSLGSEKEDIPDEKRGNNGPLSVVRKTPVSSISEAFRKAAEQCGYQYRSDYNNKEGLSEGVSHTQYTTKHGLRHDAFRAFVAPLLQNDDDNGNDDDCGAHSKSSKVRLDLVIGCSVKKIECDVSGRISTAVLAYDKDNHDQCHRFECSWKTGGQIILSCGAVYTPQILMLSGIGPSSELKAMNIPLIRDVSGVGCNLSDHVMIGQSFAVSDEFELLDLNSDDQRQRLMEHGNGAWSSSAMDTHLFVHSNVQTQYDPTNQSPDLQLALYAGRGVQDSQAAEAAATYLGLDLSIPEGESPKPLKYQLSEEQRMHSITLCSLLVQPRSVGRVKLKSPHHWDAPSIDPNYLSDDYDCRVLAEGMLRLVEMVDTGCFDKNGYRCRAIVPEGFDERSIEDWMLHCRKMSLTVYHPSGTCKMGDLNQDESAVCDARNLCVRGMSNLRVCDASIMPRPVSANTQAACLMLGHRAAQLILADLENVSPGLSKL